LLQGTTPEHLKEVKSALPWIVEKLLLSVDINELPILPHLSAISSVRATSNYEKK
jgi:hypothetical protein